MRLLARIGMQLDVLDDAEFLLESVLVFAPDYHLARYDYVRVLLQRHQNVKALAEAKTLLQAEPGNRDYRAVYATACLALADYDEAIRVYRELAAETPQAADLHLSIGHALKTLGRQQEAVSSYRTAAQVQPSFGDAYWSLANLKTYRFADDEIARMQAEEARESVRLIDRYHLCFALGKALEDRADYAQSFHYYERGNMLKKVEIRYRPEPIDRNIRLQVELFTTEFVAARRDMGCPEPDPIFIVGLPRAGSTLMEQILQPRTPRSRARWSWRISRGWPCSSRAGCRMIKETAGLPGRHRRTVTGHNCAASASNTWPIPGSIAPASRFSSTRTPIISGISVSST